LGDLVIDPSVIQYLIRLRDDPTADRIWQAIGRLADTPVGRADAEPRMRSLTVANHLIVFYWEVTADVRDRVYVEEVRPLE
jgi:hypothetical protein